MQVNGPKYKVNSINAVNPEIDPLEESQQQDIEDYFEDAFNGPQESQNDTKNFVGNANPLDDYTMGDIQGGTLSSDPFADSAEWLANFPPDIDEIIAGNEQALHFTDLIKKRYETALNDLHGLKISYEKALSAGGLAAHEIKDLNDRTGLATKALAKCEQQISKLGTLEDQLAKLHADEIKFGKDLNNDGWLGKPYTKGSYLLKHNADGSITLIDAVTKKAIPVPFMDPEYSAKLTNDDSLQMIEGGNALNNDGKIQQDKDGNWIQDGEGQVDLFLKLTQNALNNIAKHNSGCPIDLGLPETMWVEKNMDDGVTDPYKIDYDHETGESHYNLYSNWSADGGISQEVPADKSKFVQVKVTDVKIRSVDSGLRDPNHENGKLYHHFVELYNDSTLIGRIRIEGMMGTGAQSTPTNNGNYIAASSVGFAVHGDERVSPIKFDAGLMKSTGRHIVADLENQLGLTPPSSALGQKAYYENINLFSQQDITTKYFEDGEWHDHSPGFNGIGFNHNDCYIPPDVKPGENDSLLGYKTGIFISGIRGDIIGTKFNDIIQTTGVNELTDYAKDHLPEGTKPIQKGDVLYSNVIRAQGGNDIIVAGKGDNYIVDATFVHVDAGSNDDNFISTPDIYQIGVGEDYEKRSANYRAYVKVDGGYETNIATPTLNEVGYNDYADDKTENGAAEVEAHDGAYIDDYFEVDSGIVKFANPIDDEENGGDSWTQGGLDRSGIEMEAADITIEMWEEMTEVPEVDETMVQSTWEDVMGQKTMLDDEMNSFFDEMFGDMNSIMGEMDMGFEEDDLL